MQVGAGCRLLPAGLAIQMCCLISATLAAFGWRGYIWEKTKELGKEVSGRAEAVLGYTGMHREPSWLVKER